MNKKFIFVVSGAIAALIVVVIIASATANQVKQISNPAGDNITMPFVVPDSKTLFYYDGIATIKKWNLASKQVESWIKLPFADFDNISYSPDGRQAIIYWSDSNYVECAWLVDLQNKKIVDEIGQNIKANAWSPDGNKIAYEYSNNETKQNELIIASPDGSNQQIIANLGPALGDDSVDILWPNAQTVVYFAVPQTSSPVDVNAIDLTTFKQKTILPQELVNLAETVIGQNKILFSLTNQTTGIVTLNFYDLATGRGQIVDKNDLFLTKTAQIPNTDSFYSGWRQPDQTTDSIIKFDPTGQIRVVKKTLPEKLDIDYLTASDTKNLYFVNNNNHQLYQMKIGL